MTKAEIIRILVNELFDVIFEAEQVNRVVGLDKDLLDKFYEDYKKSLSKLSLKELKILEHKSS